MGRTLSERHLIYQSNVLPTLLKTLATQLRVSSESLLALEIGYALRIPLKDDQELRNCWVIPERDENGKIIGLSLRLWDGRKRMVPGSKRGLIYVPNVHQTVTEDTTYQAGPQNWIRVTDAKVSCPICNRATWCSVSRENVDDPKAVVCGRVKTGSIKTLGNGSGYLHIRKPSGYLTRPGAVLLTSDDPVLIVEGATDVAAAFDLGFVAVGRPNSTGGLDLLTKTVAARSVVVLGENDAGAGREGMEKTFAILQNITTECTKLMPPSGVKDLRQWVQQGVTHQELLDSLDLTGDKIVDESILPNAAPLEIARLWLNKFYCQQDIYTLRYFQGSWYKYVSPCYHEVEWEELRQELYVFLGDKKVQKLRPNGFDIVDYEPTQCKISQIIDALVADCLIKSGNIPRWLGQDDPTINPKQTLVFPNGMIFVDEYMAGTHILHPPTPHFFTLAAYPYDFNTAMPHPCWTKFLGELFTDDLAKVALLQEWFGYNLIPDNSQEKFMLFLGPTRAGKSTILEVLTCILGETQVLATTFRNFTRRFGLFPFLGKLAAIIGDVSVGGNYDTTETLNVLKRITGNDSVTIERKGKDIIQTCNKLYSRFTMAANVMPHFPDFARTIEARILIIQFLRSFAGQEDTTLKDRLKAEAPAILLWALEGLRRLQQNGVFTLPEGHERIVHRIRGDMTPVTDFVDECCGLGPERSRYVLKDQLYECWKLWSIRNGERPQSARWLTQCILSLYAECQCTRRVEHGTRYRAYDGISLNAQARKDFLGESI